MNVMSLFDGISGGQISLEKAGIKVDKYYASEIDKYAIQITQKHYPNTIQLGDVTQIDFTPFKGNIDLLIGGSPCTNLSICGDRTGLEGIQSRLFYDYIRAFKEIQPKYFLLENVASMTNENKNIITDIMGVDPIMINSALVSGQQRKRYYWTNIPNVTQPKDKGILLKDILEKDITNNSKLNVLYTKNNNVKYSTTEPVRLGHFGKGGQSQRIYSIEGKSVCLNTGGSIRENYKIDLPNDEYIIRKLTPLECERLQTLPDNYTQGISNTQRYKTIGNGWTIDVISHIFKGLKECT